MSSTVAATAAPTTSNPPSKMDTMSRDALLLHARKQLLLLHKTKAKCDEMGSRNVELEASLTARNNELVEMRTANSELVVKLSKVETEHMNLSRTLQDVQEQMDCMRMKEETANTTFLCLREEISSLQLENKTLKEELSQLQVTREDTMAASLESLKEELDAEHSNVISRLNAESAALLERNEKLENHCSILSAEQSAMENHIRELHDQLEKSQSQHQTHTECSDCDSLRRELSSAKSDCEKSMEIASNVSALLETKTCELEVSNEQWRVRYESLEAKLGRTTSEVGILMEATNNLQSRLDEQKRPEENAESDVVLVEALQNELQESHLREGAMRTSLNISETESQATREQLDGLRSQMEILAKENVAKKIDSVNVGMQIDSLHAVVAQLKSEREHLQSENDSLKSDVTLAKSEHDDTSTLLQLSREEYDKLKNEMSDSETKKARSENADCTGTIIAELTSRCELLMNENDKLQSALQLRLKKKSQHLGESRESQTDDSALLELTVAGESVEAIPATEFASASDDGLSDKDQLTSDIVSNLASKNCELQQIVLELGTVLANLDAKVSNLELNSVISHVSTSAVCIQTTNASTSEASVQFDGDVRRILVDAATDYEPEAAADDGKLEVSLTQVGLVTKNEILELMIKLHSLSKVIVELEGGGDDTVDTNRLLLLGDLQKWMSDKEQSMQEDEDLARVVRKLGEVIDITQDVLKTWRINITDVKRQKSKNQDRVKGSTTAETDELLNKYKMVALKAKKESAETKKKHEAVQRELSILTKAKLSMEEEIRSISSKLVEEKQKHRLTTSSLEQHSSLISLEMADYERHANDLSKQLADKQALVGVLEKDVELQLEKIQGLRLQIEQLEKQNQQREEANKQLKSASVKLRSELADFQKSESDWKVREASLSAQLESACQEVEAYKMQLADASANLRELQTSKQAMQDAHTKVVKILETKIATLTSEMETLRSEHDQCRTEYESYKVRVHSVLKQQKSKTTAAVADEVEEGKEHFEKIIQSFQTRLQELNAQHAALQSENEALQAEHHNILERHNKLVVNLADQESTWRQRLERLQSELRSEQQDQAELGRQLRMQQEAHRVATERHEMTHQRELERMQEQLGALEAHNLKLLRQKSEMESSNQSDVTLKTSPLVASREDEQTSLDMFNTERQEGEGSEFTDSVFSSSQKFRLSSPTSSFVPLEQLLNQDEIKSVSSLSVADLEKLEAQLSISSKKIEHLAEILHESEANNARTTEQVRVLKEEIRRLERNQEREKHMANMEYLKNIIVKFLALTSGDERERLVPVLTTLLRLSPEEEQKIVTVARGGADGGGLASSWSLLPRWPGTY